VDRDYKALPAERHVEVSAVLGLGPFERIVYVMTVLEHYSDHECSLPLGCARRDVLPARTRALAQIGRKVEMQDRQLSNVSAPDPFLQDGPGSLIEAIAEPPFCNIGIAESLQECRLTPRIRARGTLHCLVQENSIRITQSYVSVGVQVPADWRQ
jgi:hypothetical protein